MSIASLNLRHLRGFTEIASTKNITQAANRVAMSQPALTQAIAKLEKLLGQPLYDRRSSGIYLTDAGETFLIRVDAALHNLNEGIRRAVSRARKKGEKAVPFDSRVTMTQLRAFVAVAEARNYSIAARQTGLTQPSIHRAAKDLEQIAGLKFFTKTAQGLELTAPAQELADRVSLMFTELRHGMEDLENLAGRDTGQISVGTLPLARAYMLPHAINALLKERPRVNITVRDGLYSELLRGLRIGELDMLIGALRDELAVDDVEQHLLFNDPLAIIARPGHPLTKSKNLDWNDLVGHTWVVPRPGTPTRSYFDAQMSAVADLKDIHVIETSSLVMIRALLAESDHLTISSAHQIEREERQGILARLDFDLGGISRRIGLTTRVNWRPTKSQARFFELLKDEGSKSADAIYQLLKK